MEDWKKKTFVFGGLIGLAAGMAASYIIIQRSEKYNTLPALNAADGVKFGLGLLTLLRLVSEITVDD